MVSAYQSKTCSFLPVARRLQIYPSYMLHHAAVAVLSAASLWNAAAAVSLVALARRKSPSSPAAEGVTVLKPLCGLDTALRDNLLVFFNQTHPRYELIFGVD